MDSKTKTTLEHANENTRHIIIYNDNTIADEDIEIIARKIKACPRLEGITISGCGLDDRRLSVLAPVLGNHPSLTMLDLSMNVVDNLANFIPIIEHGKKIHTLDISDAIERTVNYQALLFAIKKSDTLAKIKVSCDPYRIGDWHSGNVSQYFDGSMRNLLKFETVRAMTDNTRSDIATNCTTNNNAAQALLTKVRSDKIKTIEDVKALNERLPAVVCLAEAESQRSEVMSLLKRLNDEVLQKFGMAIGIEIYTIHADAQAKAVVVVVPETPKVDLPTIQAVSQKLPTLAEEDIRKQMEEGRDNPLRLMEIGQDIVALVGDIALASLHAATTSQSLEKPVRSMADFFTKFSDAKKIIEQHAERPTEVAAATTTAPKPQKRTWSWSGLFSAGPDSQQAADTNRTAGLHSLADAGVLSREAGQVLQEIIPSLLGMEERLSEQLTTTYQVVSAYQHVSQQICMIKAVGDEVLAEWREEAGRTIDAVSVGLQDLAGTEEPFHVRTLASRLEFLDELDMQVKGHQGRHKLHGAIEGKQRQGVSSLRGKNIPLIAEQVATFTRQVEELQRAEVINSLANATRDATTGEQSTYILAARKTIAAIENLAGSTQEALTSMGKAAEQITAQIAPVEAAGGKLLQSPESRSTLT